MPITRTETITLYTYDELSDEAKATARDWLRGLTGNDANDFDCVIDDAFRIGALIGIEFDTRSAKTYGGSTIQVPKIHWQLSYCQGDGASFDGSYVYKKGALNNLLAAIGSESSGDKELIRIATRLQEIQKKNFYRVAAKMQSSHRFIHSGGMNVTVYNYYTNEEYDGSIEEDVTQLMRDFADWIYDCLRNEYDHMTSDEVLEETIQANEYTFDEDGNRQD